MPLNLILDPWIPVRATQGRRIIRPDEMADPEVLAPDWPRADLNVACLELLIGLVFLARPPRGLDDWHTRRRADDLRSALASLVPAFNISGEGPLFLQDHEPFEVGAKPAKILPVEKLFIDSAGQSTATKNADLMVHRGRYDALDAPLAAMALYTLQAFAPTGGAGIRTSMRGGGPMVTLVDLGTSLWDLVWANVPYGQPATIERLPWMRPTVTSEGSRVVTPEDTFAAEQFFGMPRRLRLVWSEGRCVGAVQKPHGTNYAGWRHTLTPYYRTKDEQILPRHPKGARFGYRNWLGVVVASESGFRAQSVDDAQNRVADASSVIVAGWAMSNATPVNMLYSRQPFVNLDEFGALRLQGLIEAADIVARTLRKSAAVVVEGKRLDALNERFYDRTEAGMHAALAGLRAGRGVENEWLAVLRRTALDLFDDVSFEGLYEQDITQQGKTAAARKSLVMLLLGKGKAGAALMSCLAMEEDAT